MGFRFGEWLWLDGVEQGLVSHVVAWVYRDPDRPAIELILECFLLDEVWCVWVCGCEGVRE